MHAKASADGIEFYLAAITNSFSASLPRPFDSGYMRELYEVGLRAGREGYPWMEAPPGITGALSR